MAIINKYKSIIRFFGVLKDLDWNEKKKSMKDLRESFAKKLTRDSKHFER